MLSPHTLRANNSMMTGGAVHHKSRLINEPRITQISTNVFLCNQSRIFTNYLCAVRTRICGEAVRRKSAQIRVRFKYNPRPIIRGNSWFLLISSLVAQDDKILSMTDKTAHDKATKGTREILLSSVTNYLTATYG